jgi:preprotein translocase subunit SecE
VKAEMRRVTWPSRKQVLATTWVVIAATFLFAAYFFVVDNIVNAIVTRIINYFTHQ